MKYQIVGKNISVTEGIKNKIEKKLSRLDKYFVINDDVNCRALVRSYPVGAKVEITIPTKHLIMRAEVSHEDLLTALDDDRMDEEEYQYNDICDFLEDNQSFLN